MNDRLREGRLTDQVPHRLPEWADGAVGADCGSGADCADTGDGAELVCLVVTLPAGAWVGVSADGAL